MEPRIDLQNLSLEQKVSLVEDRWDSIAAEQQALPLSDAQRAELDRRLQEYEQDGDPGRPGKRDSLV